MVVWWGHQSIISLSDCPATKMCFIMCWVSTLHRLVIDSLYEGFETLLLPGPVPIDPILDMPTPKPPPTRDKRKLLHVRHQQALIDHFRSDPKLESSPSEPFDRRTHSSIWIASKSSIHLQISLAKVPIHRTHPRPIRVFKHERKRQRQKLNGGPFTSFLVTTLCTANQTWHTSDVQQTSQTFANLSGKTCCARSRAARLLVPALFTWKCTCLLLWP